METQKLNTIRCLATAVERPITNLACLLNNRKDISDFMRRFFTVLPVFRFTVTGRRSVAFKSFHLRTFKSQYFLGRNDKYHENFRLVQPTPGSRFEPRTTFLRINRGVLNTAARRTVLWHTLIWRVSKALCYFIEQTEVWLLIEQQGGWHVLTLGQNPAGVNVII